MSLTRTNYLDYITKTWVQSDMGILLLNDSPLVNTFVSKAIYADGGIKQHASSGSLASTLGSALTATPTAAAFDPTTSYTLGMGSTMAEITWSAIDAAMAGSDIGKVASMQGALQALATGVIAGFVGANSGVSNGTFQGVNYVTSFFPGSDADIYAGASTSTSTLLGYIDRARESLIAPGEDVIIVTSPRGRAALREAMRKGNPGSVTLTDQNFTGMPQLAYEGMPVFASDAVTSQQVSGKANYYVVKLGSGACQLVLPTRGPITPLDVVTTKGSAVLTQNIVFQGQFWFQNLHSAARIISQSVTAQ